MLSEAFRGPGSSLFDRLFTPPNSIFSPQSAPAHDIFRLAMFTLVVTGAVFVIVSSLLIYAILRYRERSGKDAEREPPQIYGSNQIELAWTVIPAVIMWMLGSIVFLVPAILITVRLMSPSRETSYAGQYLEAPPDQSALTL